MRGVVSLQRRLSVGGSKPRISPEFYNVFYLIRQWLSQWECMTKMWQLDYTSHRILHTLIPTDRYSARWSYHYAQPCEPWGQSLKGSCRHKRDKSRLGPAHASVLRDCHGQHAMRTPCHNVCTESESIDEVWFKHRCYINMVAIVIAFRIKHARVYAWTMWHGLMKWIN